jgi:hypothetical protein
MQARDQVSKRGLERSQALLESERMVEPPRLGAPSISRAFARKQVLLQSNRLSLHRPAQIRRFLPRFVRFQWVAATFPSDLQSFLRSDRVRTHPRVGQLRKQWPVGVRQHTVKEMKGDARRRYEDDIGAVYALEFLSYHLEARRRCVCVGSNVLLYSRPGDAARGLAGKPPDESKPSSGL